LHHLLEFAKPISVILLPSSCSRICEPSIMFAWKNSVSVCLSVCLSLSLSLSLSWSTLGLLKSFLYFWWNSAINYMRDDGRWNCVWRGCARELLWVGQKWYLLWHCCKRVILCAALSTQQYKSIRTDNFWCNLCWKWWESPAHPPAAATKKSKSPSPNTFSL
jgi:hypothetical protein